jgi:hypothetical protein
MKNNNYSLRPGKDVGVLPPSRLSCYLQKPPDTIRTFQIKAPYRDCKPTSSSAAAPLAGGGLRHPPAALAPSLSRPRRLAELRPASSRSRKSASEVTARPRRDLRRPAGVRPRRSSRTPAWELDLAGRGGLTSPASELNLGLLFCSASRAPIGPLAKPRSLLRPCRSAAPPRKASPSASKRKQKDPLVVNSSLQRKLTWRTLPSICRCLEDLAKAGSNFIRK